MGAKIVRWSPSPFGSRGSDGTMYPSTSPPGGGGFGGGASGTTGGGTGAGSCANATGAHAAAASPTTPAITRTRIGGV